MYCVIRSIEENAASRGFAPAVINGDRVITYADVIDLIARVSNHFLDRRVPPRSRLFLNMVDPDLRLIVSLAAIHAGMIPYVATDLGELQHGIDFEFIVGSPAPYVRGLPADLVIDESVLGGRLSDPKLRDLPDRDDGEILFFAGTSGTTGRRKIVAERQGPFAKKVLGQIGHEPPLTQDDRALVTLGDATKFGFGYALRILHSRGAMLRPDSDMQRRLNGINLYGVTFIQTTPNELEAMVSEMERSNTRAPSVKRVVLGGALVPKSLVLRAAKVFDCKLEINYGSSEVGRISYGTIEPDAYQSGYVGEVIPSLRIVNSGSRDDPAPIILANDQSIFCEYYESGRMSKVAELFYTMPDLGYLEGQRLFLTGRNDEVLNLDGTKFPFSAIESVLLQEAGVSDVGLVAPPVEWEESGVIVGLVGGDMDVSVLAEKVGRSLGLARATANLHFVRLPAIVRNQTGKVDRRALLDAFRRSRTSET